MKRDLRPLREQMFAALSLRVRKGGARLRYPRIIYNTLYIVSVNMQFCAQGGYAGQIAGHPGDPAGIDVVRTFQRLAGPHAFGLARDRTPRGQAGK